MIGIVKQLFIGFALLSISNIIVGQEGPHNPIKFEYSQLENNLVIDATIEKGWHLYAANLPDPSAGPLPTEFIFEESTLYTVSSETIESEGHTEVDDAFGVEVKFFEDHAQFQKKVTINFEGSAEVKGTIYYMVCNDESCIPFDVPLSLMMTE